VFWRCQAAPSARRFLTGYGLAGLGGFDAIVVARLDERIGASFTRLIVSSPGQRCVYDWTPTRRLGHHLSKLPLQPIRSRIGFCHLLSEQTGMPSLRLQRFLVVVGLRLGAFVARVGFG
jgi:hypothetical protein